MSEEMRSGHDNIKEKGRRDMLDIFERNNIIIEVAEQAVHEGKKIYIYGCGQMGNILEKGFEANGIKIDAFIIDKQFWYEGIVVNKKIVLCIDDILNDEEEKIIFIALRDYDRKKVQEHEEIYVNEDVFSLHCMEEDDICMDYDFVEKNMKKLQSFFEELQDKKSRNCMEAFLNQKISGKFSYLENLYEKNQYYDKQIVNFTRIESMIDCGAYDGDSYLSFLKNYNEAVGKEYDGRAYLLEPDTENYSLLQQNCGDDVRCKLLSIGAWDEKTVLTFSEGGTSSGITEDGTISIPVDTIDNVTNGEVDFIKMDIEGSEYKALLGAKETIKANHPILAICVYHKKRDLLEIPELIKSICPEYKFYLRAYSKYSQELVLYAICE